MFTVYNVPPYILNLYTSIFVEEKIEIVTNTV